MWLSAALARWLREKGGEQMEEEMEQRGANWGNKGQCKWKGDGGRMAGIGMWHTISGAAGNSLYTTTFLIHSKQTSTKAP